MDLLARRVGMVLCASRGTNNGSWQSRYLTIANRRHDAHELLPERLRLFLYTRDWIGSVDRYLQHQKAFNQPPCLGLARRHIQIGFIEMLLAQWSDRVNISTGSWGICQRAVDFHERRIELLEVGT